MSDILVTAGLALATLGGAVGLGALFEPLPGRSARARPWPCPGKLFPAGEATLTVAESDGIPFRRQP